MLSDGEENWKKADLVGFHPYDIVDPRIDPHPKALSTDLARSRLPPRLQSVLRPCQSIWIGDTLCRARNTTRRRCCCQWSW